AAVVATLFSFLAAIWLMRDRLQALAAFEALNLAKAQPTDLVWGFPLRVLALVLAIAPLLIWLWRLAANSLEYRLIGWSAQPRRLLVVGSLAAADAERLRAGKRPVYHLLGRVGGQREEGAAPYLGPLEDLPAILSHTQPHEVFIAAFDLNREQIRYAIEHCLNAGARPRLLLGVYETLVAAADPCLEKDTPYICLQPPGISGWPWVAKRLMDVAIAGAALAVTAPLIILACVAIVIETKGRPIFSQERIGQYGRRFRLYKLRTMVADADMRGGPLTTAGDPRITRVGRFLRRTSIDELPQLWNVLKGDMSLVGPRAVVSYVVDNFQDWEAVSLAVRPGLTGLAQISGRDEIGFREKSLLNLYYVRNHSLWLDLRVLFETVAVVLSMEGTSGTRGAERCQPLPPAAGSGATAEDAA
ncbi:MAG: sugar transferase, partial [Planctomycetota bacterium]|nr:sugar transferase [Planctomycetota bacterium]